MKKRDFAFMLLGSCLFASCGATFPYHYYGLDLQAYKLRGPDTSQDLDLTECLPTESDKSPCSCEFTPVMEALKQDYVDTKNQLIACQHQLANQ